jgi:hypothetical protein
VKKYQTEQYLGADGVAGKTTLEALNVPVEARIDQVRVNMERARWLLYKLQGTFVVVDIAGYKVALYRDGQPIWRSRVQVGKPFRSTPVFPVRDYLRDVQPDLDRAADDSGPGYVAQDSTESRLPGRQPDPRARSPGQCARTVNRRLVQRKGP